MATPISERFHIGRSSLGTSYPKTEVDWARNRRREEGGRTGYHRDCCRQGELKAGPGPFGGRESGILPAISA
jgi:hypothetical protein